MSETLPLCGISAPFKVPDYLSSHVDVLPDELTRHEWRRVRELNPLFRLYCLRSFDPIFSGSGFKLGRESQFHLVRTALPKLNYRGM